MARRIHNAKLDTRTARSRLTLRREPYWTNLTSGLAVGYRKGKTGGTWIARRYVDGKRTYEQIGPADDVLDDGAYSFDAAQAKAREWFAINGPVRNASAGPYTVADAMDDYIKYLESDGRAEHTIYDTRRRDQVLIRPKLGKFKVADLTPERLRGWRDELVKSPQRLRTKKGADQKHRKPIEGADLRPRRATANRTWTTLRAALNHAFREGKVASDLAWRKVQPFRAVDGARVRYLAVAEAKRLINACDPEFRLLVEAALLTGARYGELSRLVVADFNSDVGTVTVGRSKSGKARHIVLTDEGRRFFARQTAGLAGNEGMFSKTWGAAHQIRPMAKAVKVAKITPPVSFHGLRHTWASLAVMNGVPLMVVARNLGHADTRMVEKHYGHLAPNYIADEIRKGAPVFGIKTGAKVVSIDRGKHAAGS